MTYPSPESVQRWVGCVFGQRDLVKMSMPMAEVAADF